MVLVLAETQNGKFRKSAFETVTFARQTAEKMGSGCAALVLGAAEDPGALGNYGADKVFHVDDAKLVQFDDQVYTHAIAHIAQEQGAKLVIVPHSFAGKAVIGRLAVRLRAASATNVQSIDQAENGLVATRPAFSGKAIAHYTLGGEKCVVSMMSNAVQPVETGDTADVSTISVDLPDPVTVVREVSRVEGRVPLPEAELVVSAGRGMKDGSNWGIIEELAEVMGATTACSRPVADSGWRPHHEHVGQTGIAIRPNLYLAIGISGAIQHLAGVNNSKVIVVINKDPEAPFFKAADYGVLGDLFDVVPRLTEVLRRFKSQS